MTATVLASIMALLIYAFISAKRYRESVLQRSGSLKRLPGNKWFGTIPAMVDIFKSSPQDAHPQGTMTLLYRKHKLDNIWFMDAWPVTGEPQIIIADPGVAAQVSQTKSLPKHYEVRRYLEHMTGSQSLILREGDTWKKSRTMFNPGFALSHLMTLVPSIVDDTSVYFSVLDRLATSGEVFQLETVAAKLMFDIMGHVVLDHGLNSQIGPNALVDSFRTTVGWAPSPNVINPFVNYNPVKFLVHKFYERRMNNYLSKVLDDRYTSKPAQADLNRKTRKPAIDLAIDEYARQEAEEGRKSSSGIDPKFKSLAIDQMKSFLFAGHDTSSTTLCFIYHNLSKHPQVAKKIKQEHDEVLGSDVTRVANLLKEKPNLMSKLPYTTAVIKETLRLYPPASTVRNGQPDVNINFNGQTYRTEGCLVWIVSHTLHRRPDLFPEPDAFIPERFLPQDDPNCFQEIPKDAYRPFEKGPRNCIGQELALLEIKIALVMTCRVFEIENAFQQWDRKMGEKSQVINWED